MKQMPITPELLTDLYEFTMAAGYWRERMFEEAVFSLFIRDYPPNRAYFVAAGLDSLLDLVERFRFPDQALAYLAGLGLFPDEFLNYLKVLKFTGSIRAVAEGRMVFSGEPLLEIRAPIIQGQLL
ncbi:MAG: nicotinate phosphoribosyltransferase, partial [Syntrophobacteraceae bacterium CG07_land_8_20_14_0_80_61_8]